MEYSGGGGLQCGLGHGDEVCNCHTHQNSFHFFQNVYRSAMSNLRNIWETISVVVTVVSWIINFHSQFGQQQQHTLQPKQLIFRLVTTNYYLLVSNNRKSRTLQNNNCMDNYDRMHPAKTWKNSVLCSVCIEISKELLCNNIKNCKGNAVLLIKRNPYKFRCALA